MYIARGEKGVIWAYWATAANLQQTLYAKMENIKRNDPGNRFKCTANFASREIEKEKKT